MNKRQAIAGTGLLISIVGVGLFLNLFIRIVNIGDFDLITVLSSDSFIGLATCSTIAGGFGILFRSNKPSSSSPEASSKPPGSVVPPSSAVTVPILRVGTTIVYNDQEKIQTIRLPCDAYALPPSTKPADPEGPTQPESKHKRRFFQKV